MFYRPVTKEDFEHRLEDLTYEYDVPPEILALITRDGIPVVAVKKYRDIKGEPLYKCKQILEQYLELHRAYQDYQQGKPVFINY